MCKFKSAIILKDSVFVTDYDSHADMLTELGIEDSWKNAKSKFIRAELTPPNGDIFLPVETWNFRVDQDIVPDWYVAEIDKERMVLAVKEWSKEHIFVNKSDFEIGEGLYYLVNSKVKAYGYSTVIAYGYSTVIAYGYSTVIAYDNSKVKAYDNSTVETRGNSTVKAYGNSKVETRGNSTVRACDNSTVSACDNSTVKAYDNSKVKAYGNSKVIACGNSKVEAYNGSNIVIPLATFAKYKSRIILSDNATLIDYRTKTIYQASNWRLLKQQYCTGNRATEE